MRERVLRELHRESGQGRTSPAQLMGRLTQELEREPTELTAIEAQIFTGLAVAQLAKASLLERFAFARDVSAFANTPRPVVTRLLEDDHLVAAAVIEQAPLAETDLLRLICAKDSERVQCAIARRPDLGEAISDLLVAKGRPAVLAELAGNRRVTLSKTSLEILCDAAVRQTAMGQALARRSDLPPPIAALLKRRIEARHLVHEDLSDDELKTLLETRGGEAEEVAIASRAPLSVDMTDYLIDRGRPCVMLALAGNVDAKISDRGFDVLSNIAARQAQMDETLARRHDLPPIIARNLVRRLGERMQARLDDLIRRDLGRGRRTFVLREATGAAPLTPPARSARTPLRSNA